MLDIRDNARFAQKWTALHTRETFVADTRTFYAVTRCLEIVSEASRRLPQELRDRHSQLPWRAIMDAGNIYRHRYDNVAEDLVWDTVQQDLPSLLAVADSEIASLPDTPPSDEQPDLQSAKPFTSDEPDAEDRQPEDAPPLSAEPDIEP